MEGRHSLYIVGSESLTVTDVTDVESFSDEEVAITLSEGGLVIKGEGLHMIQLDLEAGRAELSGKVSSLEYTAGHVKIKGFWARLWK